MREILNNLRNKGDSLIVASFVDLKVGPEEERRIRFFILITLVAISILFGFVVFHLGKVSLVRSVFNAIVGLILILSLVVIRYLKSARTAFRISVLVLGTYFIFLMIIGGAYGSRIFWMLIYPVYTFLIMGKREGLAWTVAGLLVSLYVLTDPNQLLSTYPYEGIIKSRFLITYGIIAIVAYVFESERERYQQAMNAKRLLLESEVADRMRAKETLNKYKNHLEEIVNERTAQLQEVNSNLEKEIGERELAEKALKASEARYRLLVNNAPIGIVSVDKHGKILDVNEKLLEILGSESPEATKAINVLTFSNLVEAGISGVIKRCLDEGIEQYCEVPLITAWGKDVYLRILLTPNRDSFNNVIGCFGIVEDISERKKTEDALREAHQIINRSPAVAFLWRNEEGWPVEFATDNVLNLLEYAAEEFTSGRVIYKKVVHPDDLDRVARGKAAFSAEEGKDALSISPYRIVTSTGAIKWVRDSTYIRRDDANRVTHFQGIVEDITEQIRARHDLAEAQAILLASIEQSPVGILIADAPDVRIQMANSAALDILGIAEDKFAHILMAEAQRLWPVYHWDGTPFDPDELPLSRAVLLGERSRNVELLVKDSQGGDRFILANSGPVRGEDWQIIAGVCVFYNVTERRRAEEKRLDLERQLLHAQKLESLGVLAGGIAHDFNNILTAVLGNADLALMKLSPLSPAKDNIEEIKNGALRGAGLSNQMLAYSGKGKFVLDTVNLTELVREMIQLLEISISKKVSLKCNLDDSLPSIEGDVTQLRQIAMNLITNASEAIGDNSGLISLRTGSMYCEQEYLDEIGDIVRSGYEVSLRAGTYVFLEVSDTGCGMDCETSNKVFDPFFTTKFSGRGLGMSAVLGIVRGHNGVIKVYSEVGKGSTFKVFLPALEDVPALEEIEKTYDSRLGSSITEQYASGVVLVADDDESVLRVAGDMLDAMGFRVLMATNGREAVEMFAKESDEIVCVVLDLTMPEMDGLEAFEQIRKVRPDVNVILSSGYNEQDATQRFTGKGLAGFIQKPYTISEMRNALITVLGKGEDSMNQM